MAGQQKSAILGTWPPPLTPERGWKAERYLSRSAASPRWRAPRSPRSRRFLPSC